MSARDAWRALLEATFPRAGHVLWVGDKRLSPEHAQHARDLSSAAALGERFDGIGWVTRAEVRSGPRALRARLAPGGVLLVIVDEPPLLGAVTRALRLSAKADSSLLTEASEALLLAGLERPRVLAAGRPRLVLAADKPSRDGALDTFFEQPLL